MCFLITRPTCHQVIYYYICDFSDHPTLDLIPHFPINLYTVFQVIVDLQWFADAMSSVVGLIALSDSARETGMIDVLLHVRNRCVVDLQAYFYALY